VDTIAVSRKPCKGTSPVSPGLENQGRTVARDSRGRVVGQLLALDEPLQGAEVPVAQEIEIDSVAQEVSVA
jgi:hypothetical protein